MRSRLAPRIVAFVALLPLLVGAVAGLGYDRLRCTFTGEVLEGSDVGCCPAEDAPLGPVANAASCCDHESARAVHIPGEAASSRSAAIVPLPLPATQVVTPPPAPRAGVIAARTGAQAPPSQPPLLVKQSLLI